MTADPEKVPCLTPDELVLEAAYLGADRYFGEAFRELWANQWLCQLERFAPITVLADMCHLPVSPRSKPHLLCFHYHSQAWIPHPLGTQSPQALPLPCVHGGATQSSCQG